MFGKLLKYEFKATRGRMLALFGISIVLLGLTMGTYFILDAKDVETGAVLSAFFLVLLSSIVPLVCLILCIIRFYKSSYGAGGYLTRSLPVPQKQAFWAKTLCACVWLTIAYLLALVCLGLYALFFYLANQADLLWDYTYEFLVNFWENLKGYTRVVLCISLPLTLLFALVNQVMLYEFCFVIGNTRGLRRLGLGAPILAFIVYRIVSQILNVAMLFASPVFGLTEDGGIAACPENFFNTLNGMGADIIIPIPIAIVLLSIGFFIFMLLFSQKHYEKDINLK